MKDEAGTATPGAKPSRGLALRMDRRRALLLGALGGAAAVSATGLLSPRFIRSPQQVIADTAPPPPTTLTAPVTRQIVRSTVNVRGSVAAAVIAQATPAGVAVDAVVTGLAVRVGDTVTPGAVLAEISGRPFIAFPGPMPAYRDLRPLDQGKDVSQLQSAVIALGYACWDQSGTFGSGTKHALTSLYQDLGYPVPTTGAADVEELARAREEVAAAERAVADTREALERARLAPPPEPWEPDPVVTAQRDLDAAKRYLQSATQDLVAVEARMGPMLPRAEYVFVPDLPARVESVGVVVGSAVTDPLVTLGTGALQVNVLLERAQAALVSEGMTAEIFSITDDTAFPATVGPVRPLEIAPSGGFTGQPTVVVPQQPLPPDYAGREVRVAVYPETTDGEVLAVPVSAIYAAPDGGALVIQVRDGVEHEVPVSLGLTGDGYVEIRPLAGGLAPGDLVVVGIDTVGRDGA